MLQVLCTSRNFLDRVLAGFPVVGRGAKKNDQIQELVVNGKGRGSVQQPGSICIWRRQGKKVLDYLTSSGDSFRSLQDATIDLEADKTVTQEDAAKVLDAEMRGSPTGEPLPGGVAAAMQAAADINERAGLIEPASGDHPRAFPFEDTPVLPQEQDAFTPEIENTPKPASGEEKAPSSPTLASREKVHAKED